MADLWDLQRFKASRKGGKVQRVPKSEHIKRALKQCEWQSEVRDSVLLHVAAPLCAPIGARWPRHMNFGSLEFAAPFHIWMPLAWRSVKT